MEYPSVRGRYLPGYTDKATWDLLHAYIDEHRKMLIDEYPGNVLQAITILQSHYSNITFSDKSRYTILFLRVIHKGWDSSINYIKIFKNDKALEILVENN